MSKPGIEGKSFYLKFDDNSFKKRDIIRCSGPQEFKIIRIINLNWWRKILIRFGFKIYIGHIKVKPL